MRVVLDINVLLSGIAHPASIPGKILTVWHRGSLELVLSDYRLDELRRVLPRLSRRHGLSATEIDDLVDALSIQAEVIEPDKDIDPELRDAGDQPMLGTLVARMVSANIDYLINGDKDLLALSLHYPIISPAQFWAQHGGA